MSQISAWGLAIRPKTLPLAFAPVLLGVSVASSAGLNRVNWKVALVCAAVSLLLQIAANLANDLFDHLKGTDTEQRKGPIRMTQAGHISVRAMVIGTTMVFFLASVSGAYLVWHGGAWFAVLGGLAILSALAYTAGPFPLGYNGLGDLFVFVFFGLVAVLGTEWLVSLRITVMGVLGAVAMGLLCTNVLVVNNLRDWVEDKAANKRTLVVLFGTNQGRRQYVGSMLLAFFVCALGAGFFSEGWILLPFLLVPFGVGLVRTVLKNETGEQMNRLLGSTAAFALAFAFLLSVGVVLGEFL